MAAYIAAAERYFQELPAPEKLFAKPFVPLGEAAYNLSRLGHLLHHLDHHGPHTVLDFGAGMCWLTSVLLHSGCRVVALDVSRSALKLGAEAVRIAHPALPPGRVRFVSYGGFHIPLEDASVDRIACYDALHHVPNKRTILREMYRVLRPTGRACFAEPGPGHAASQLAQDEAKEWGVLEDEVDAPGLCAMAAEEGYGWSYVVPLPMVTDNEMTPEDYASLRADSASRLLPWSGNDALIVLGKGPRHVRDSRAPSRLYASVEIMGCPDRVSPGDVFEVTLRVENRGDTEWLALRPDAHADRLDYGAVFLAEADEPPSVGSDESVAGYRRYIERNGLEGLVTVGAKIWAVPSGQPVDLDYGRGFFAANVLPQQFGEVSMRLRAPLQSGLFRLAFDPVSEYVAWFSDVGSPVAHRYLRVGPDDVPDSRSPGSLTGSVQILDSGDLNQVAVRLSNTGDSTWLAHPIAEGGWVQVGLQAAAPDGQCERDWRRARLPRDVGPGESVVVVLDLSNASPQWDRVHVALVAELRQWFADRGASRQTVFIRERPGPS